MRTALLLTALFLSPLLQRGQSQWTQTNGPDNGRIACLASIDTILFAGTDGGVFLSTNRAGSWTQPMSELWAHEIGRFAVMGTQLFAAPSYGGRVSRSSDYGISWTPAGAGLPPIDISDLAVIGSRIFVGTHGSGVYRSGDSGATWIPVKAGLFADTVAALATCDTVIFAGMHTGEVFRSSDYGEHWLPLAPLPSGAPVTALGTKDTLLFAGADSGRVFRSHDRGASWVPNPTGSIDYVTSFSFIDTSVFVGTTYSLLRSTLTGSSWTAVHKDNMYRSVNVLHALGGDLYAGTMGGVYRSTDRGESWTDGNSGMKNASVRALVMEGTALYAATWGGGVFRSSDRGSSWKCSLKENAIFSLAFTRTHFYAGGWGMLYDSSLTSEVLWILSYPDTTNRVFALAVSGDTVYAGTESGGLYRTRRISDDWNLSRIGFKDTAVNCLALDGADLYAGTAKGLYRSSDEGAHWTPLDDGLTSRDIRALAFKGADLFAGTAGGGVFRSTDKGAAWTPVNEGLTNVDVLSFTVQDDNLFAGTWEGGVFLSEDNGANWKEVSDVSTVDANFRIPGVIHALAVDETYLYAGERRTGLWMRPLSEMVTSAEPPGVEIPGVYALMQNFPNPFNPGTTIRFNLPHKCVVDLTVFNMLGQEVGVLVRGEVEAGRGEVKFDGTNLSSGVYLCRMKAGDYLATKKLILQK